FGQGHIELITFGALGCSCCASSCTGSQARPCIILGQLRLTTCVAAGNGHQNQQQYQQRHRASAQDQGLVLHEALQQSLGTGVGLGSGGRSTGYRRAGFRGRRSATLGIVTGLGIHRARGNQSHLFVVGGVRRLARIAIVRIGRLGLGQRGRRSGSSVRALGDGGSGRLYAFRLGNLGVGSDITGLLPCRILRRQLGDLLSLGPRQDVRQ